MFQACCKFTKEVGTFVSYLFVSVVVSKILVVLPQVAPISTCWISFCHIWGACWRFGCHFPSTLVPLEHILVHLEPPCTPSLNKIGHLWAQGAICLKIARSRGPRNESFSITCCDFLENCRLLKTVLSHEREHCFGYAELPERGYSVFANAHENKSMLQGQPTPPQPTHNRPTTDHNPIWDVVTRRARRHIFNGKVKAGSSKPHNFGQAIVLNAWEVTFLTETTYKPIC